MLKLEGILDPHVIHMGIYIYIYIPMTQGVSFKIPLFERAPDDWQQVTYHRYWIHEDITHSVYANDGIRTWCHKSIYWYDTNLGLEDFRSIDSDQRE